MEKETEHLLTRTPTKAYQQEWAELMSGETKISKKGQEVSMVVFRLGVESFALETKYFSDISLPKIVHKLPMIKNPAVMGVVNIKGQIKTVISLHKLLDLDALENPYQQRLLVMEDNQEVWAFVADELFGIFTLDKETIGNVPINITKSSVNFLKGTFHWGERGAVGLLDETLLFPMLRRKIP